MPMLAECVDAVIGADTHADTHTLAMLTPTGAPLAMLTVANTPAGYAAALGWAVEHAPGRRLAFAIEGTRSYGAGLARAVAAAGFPVLEVTRPARGQRRGRGKSDRIDAELAALSVLRLPADRLAAPRVDGDREALRILLGARQEIVETRTRQANRLRALLRTGGPADRPLADGPLTAARLAAIADRPGQPGQTREQAVRRAEAARLAHAIRAADRELAANLRTLTEIVADLAPTLLDRTGIGPVSAAQAIVAYSHHGRVRNDAAFAALAGTNPIPATSGKTQHRHRLNRGGDRTLNRAVHAIAHTRMVSDPRTRAYVTRRRTEGKTPKEIRRCLKRYITRELYRALNTAPALDNP